VPFTGTVEPVEPVEPLFYPLFITGRYNHLLDLTVTTTQNSGSISAKCAIIQV
jgi:hypothetical protein